MGVNFIKKGYLLSKLKKVIKKVNFFLRLSFEFSCYWSLVSIFRVLLTRRYICYLSFGNYDWGFYNGCL